LHNLHVWKIRPAISEPLTNADTVAALSSYPKAIRVAKLIGLDRLRHPGDATPALIAIRVDRERQSAPLPTTASTRHREPLAHPG